MSISDNLSKIKKILPDSVTLIVVTKTQPIQSILEVYESGCNQFGENKVQEMVDKYEKLPKDIKWHLIGHLQSNKVKYIAPFVFLIHSVDSFPLLKEINKQALKNNRTIKCLLQIYIAKEETKFGLDFNDAEQLLISEELKQLKNIEIAGFMGMATNTNNHEQISNEFQSLNDFFIKYKSLTTSNINIKVLSMGMSSDYQIAIEKGSTMIRVGSSIFGTRN